MQSIYDRLYDEEIVSDLRIKAEDGEKVVFGVKRSKFLVTIRKKVTPEIAYLAGAIAGDGCLHFTWPEDRKYPRIRISITGSDTSYLSFLNLLFSQSFGAGGQIHREKRKKNCYVLLVNHRVIWLYFRKILGLDKKRLCVPEQLANPTLFVFFLAGFFDTDGYLSQGAFGTMMGGKSLNFLNQVRDYTAKFYSIEFAPVKVNILTVKNKIFKRAYTRLTKSESKKFAGIVPLRNRKYGPTQIRTGDLRCSEDSLEQSSTKPL